MADSGTLGQLASLRSGYAFKSSSWKSEGFPVVKIKNVLDGVVSLQGCAYVGSDDAQKAADYLAREGDVLISLTGYVGQVGRVPQGAEVLVNQRVGLVTPHVSEDRSYVYHLLRLLKPQVEELGTGTAQSNVAPRDILELPIPHLSESQRRSVAVVLDEFDEKIRINTLISQNLEHFASKIFRSWFIDFDPVKAKMAGEAPVGLDAETAALFPDSMAESELGEIPTGWIAQPLDSVAEYLNGLAMQKFPVVDESDVLPVIKIAQLRAGHTEGADLASGALDPRYVIEDGDILFSWSGTLEVKYWSGGRGALNQHLFKVTGKTVPDWFAYFATHAHLGEFRAIASSKATTMGHIQRRHLTEAHVAVPPNEVLEQASRLVGPLLSLRTVLLKQNTTLGNIRDSLLPRLISGELEIPDEMLAA